MERKLLAFASSVILMGAVATGFAATPVKTTYSPFKDNLTIHFSGFTERTLFYAAYSDNNGVNINGPAFATTDNDALVVISSNNKVDYGYPSMSISYPALFSDQECTITFLDGPYVPALTFDPYKLPICPGLTLSEIQRDKQNNYSMTITNNEP